MLRLPTNKKQTMLNGAITLVITTLIVKVIGVLYKIPLTAMLGEVGHCLHFYGGHSDRGGEDGVAGCGAASLP